MTNRQMEGARPNIDGYSESGSIGIGSRSSDVGNLLDVDNVDRTEEILVLADSTEFVDSHIGQSGVEV